MGGERTEDLDVPGDGRELDFSPGAHRQGGETARGHQLPAGADGQSGHHGAADSEYRYGRGVLRDVLRQRARAEGQPGGADQPGLDDGEEPAEFRTDWVRFTSAIFVCAGTAEVAGRAHGGLGRRGVPGSVYPAAA